ncbi:hypothetical protein Naga_101330g1, partial [Nannochloropsis gaditana]
MAGGVAFPPFPPLSSCLWFQYGAHFPPSCPTPVPNVINNQQLSQNMAAAPPSRGMEGGGPRQPSGLGGNVGLGGISTEGMEDLPKYDEEISKCKRFLLEFEDGEVVNIEGGEDGEAAGLGIGRKKYKILMQRIADRELSSLLVETDDILAYPQLLSVAEGDSVEDF